MEFVSAGETAGIDCAAYVNRASGEIHWVGDGVPEDPPDDLEDGTLYVAVPTQSALDLGRSVALSFAAARLPDSYDVVRGYFAKRGAYQRFKALLERTGQLDAWYAFEKATVEERLREWCDENGFVPVLEQSDG